MDGVERVSQAAIRPGDCFTYRFRAYPAGTHWYHSHTGVQYSDGLFGPLIIEENENPYKNDYNYDRIIMINDWFHIPSEQILANLKKGAYMPMKGGAAMKTGASMTMDMGSDEKDPKVSMYMQSADMPDVGDVPFESALINGKGRFDPSSQAPLEIYEVNPQDRIRFRIINASSTYAFRFAIDEHKLSVIATDGALTRPLEVDSLIIDVGERFDVIVKADRPAANYWIRAKTLEDDKEDHALAVLRYRGASVDLPKSTAAWGTLLKLGDLKPYTPQKSKAPTTDKLLVLTGSMMPYRWMVNGQVFELPRKPLTEDRNPPEPPVTQMKLKEGDVVRVVINNESKMSHPFHLHGHYFHVLGLSAEGAGKYNGQALNETDPIQKDNLTIPRNGWGVVQWEAGNPGCMVFPLSHRVALGGRHGYPSHRRRPSAPATKRRKGVTLRHLTSLRVWVLPNGLTNPATQHPEKIASFRELSCSASTSNGKCPAAERPLVGCPWNASGPHLRGNASGRVLSR